MEHSMDQQRIAQLRAQAASLWQQVRARAARVPAKTRVVLGFFLAAALLMGLYTAFAGKDARLHLKVQHGFRSAQISVWVDGDLAYSGTLTGSMKKKFGLIPDSVQGSLSQVVPVSPGQHQVRVRVAPDEGSTQEDSLSGDFARNTERDLSVVARRNGLSLNWQGTATAAESSSGSGWLARYASTLLLSIAGSIISALTGYAIKELPGQIRSRQDAPKAESTAAGQ